MGAAERNDSESCAAQLGSGRREVLFARARNCGKERWVFGQCLNVARLEVACAANNGGRHVVRRVLLVVLHEGVYRTRMAENIILFLRDRRATNIVELPLGIEVAEQVTNGFLLSGLHIPCGRRGLRCLGRCARRATQREGCEE